MSDQDTKPNSEAADETGAVLTLHREREAGAVTPRDPSPAPAPPHTDLSNPDYYLNREITWLNFNFRVLHEARDPRNPLLERVKFLAIVASNVDEFFMKRIGGLKQQVAAGVHDATADGRKPEEQITDCYELVSRLLSEKKTTQDGLLEQLADEGIRIREYGELDDTDRAAVRSFYEDNIFPLVTPQATDPAHPFPFISNLSLNLLVTLRYPKGEVTSLARVKVPSGVGSPRFVRVGQTGDFVPVEDIMANNLDLLFPGMVIESCWAFRVTRNSNVEQEEEEADDLLEMIETELRERRFAPVVRLEVDRSMDSYYRGMLAAELGLDEHEDVFEVNGMLGPSDLMELCAIDRPELKYPPHHPSDHGAFLDQDRSIFHIVREAGSVVVHHPYESYTTSVERFLAEASRDPKVRAIKMTLYRTSEDSKVMSYLIDAARNGKQVAVVMELKARFDEEANIRWATRLGEVGIHVTYGVVGLKTHCKVILVVRQDYSGLTRYAHIGTGNYHAGTARQYTDLGLLTSDPDFGRDLTELFNYLTTGYKPKRKYTKLLPAPRLLKPALLKAIDREIRNHRLEQPGRIVFKMNGLEDVDVVRALYRASQAGVKVDLIVRDVCRLRPGIPGLSDNIRVVSIVGRFLEHSRIFYFHNDGAEDYWIGSADLMTRNLVSRVEVLAPVNAPELMRDLRFILEACLADNRGAWDMAPDGSYTQRDPGEDSESSCQAMLVERAEKKYKEANRLKWRRTRTAREPDPDDEL